jgi:molybdopterin-guanine dinucleotide biosynthesis protein A
MDDVMGMVMAGGFSSRMGTDKALIRLPDGKSWLQKQVELLRPFFYRTVLSVRNNQDYSAEIPDALYIRDEEIADGPLRGILSVHRQYPDLHLFVVAVDLPQLDKNALSKLLINFRQHPEKDCIVFKDNFFEPLCCIYSSAFLKKMNLAWEDKKIESFSLQKIIGDSNALILPMTEKEKVSLLNVNEK